MLEMIIVFGIVWIVLVLAARSLYKTLTGKGGGCNCGTGSCSSSAFCDSSALKGKDR